MLANNHSAGVYTFENDRSQRLKAASTSVGAIVGASKRGPVMVPTLTVDNEDYRTVFGKPDAQVGFMHHSAELFHEEASRLYSVRVALDYKFGGMFIHTETNFSKTRPLSQGFKELTEVQFSPNDILFIYAADPGNWNNDINIVYYPDTHDAAGEAFYIEVYEGTSSVPVETHHATTHDFVNGNGKQMNVEDVINGSSQRIRVAINEDHPGFDTRDNPKLINAIGTGDFTGGDDGRDIRTGDSEALAQILQAWDLYDDWEKLDVHILINGGYALPAVHLKMDEIAVKRKDCIAVLDMPSDQQETTKAVNYRREVLNLNSSHSAMYTPDILIRDTDNGRDIYIPPSGYVASRYAYTDRVEAAWFAPGGTDRGNLSLAKGLAEAYKLGHQNALAENQINCIRKMSGNGINIWGADTMYGIPSALQDVGVRRMLCFLHASVRINQLYGVFEPNDDILKSQQKESCEDLLRPIKRGRGLDWFEVICDRRNNPNDQIDNGDLVVDIYLDPTRYTKRIHLNAVVPKTGEIKFAEELLTQE